MATELRYYWAYNWKTDKVTKKSVKILDETNIPDFDTYTADEVGKYVGHLIDVHPRTGQRICIVYTTRDCKAVFLEPNKSQE